MKIINSNIAEVSVGNGQEQINWSHIVEIEEQCIHIEVHMHKYNLLKRMSVEHVT